MDQPGAVNKKLKLKLIATKFFMLIVLHFKE